jgi:hypothetical protein
VTVAELRQQILNCEHRLFSPVERDAAETIEPALWPNHIRSSPDTISLEELLTTRGRNWIQTATWRLVSRPLRARSATLWPVPRKVEKRLRSSLYCGGPLLVLLPHNPNSDPRVRSWNSICRTGSWGRSTSIVRGQGIAWPATRSSASQAAQQVRTPRRMQIAK